MVKTDKSVFMDVKERKKRCEDVVESGRSKNVVMRSKDSMDVMTA